MSNYAIFFDYDNKTYRLPVNPEEIEVARTQAIEKYEILKLGQIAVPTHMELSEYSFECEFPKNETSYVETGGNFQNADYYVKLFTNWMNNLIPVQFKAGMVNTKENELEPDAIDTLVLIEDLTITEKAGEEGDKYVSFKLLEYREYGKKFAVVAKNKVLAKAVKTSHVVAVNPKSKGTHVVKSGDSLWAIAKKYYGDGSKYTKIYNANKDKIKNPGLIYSGQKLTIPS